MFIESVPEQRRDSESHTKAGMIIIADFKPLDNPAAGDFKLAQKQRRHERQLTPPCSFRTWLDQALTWMFTYV